MCEVELNNVERYFSVSTTLFVEKLTISYYPVTYVTLTCSHYHFKRFILHTSWNVGPLYRYINFNASTVVKLVLSTH